MVVRVTLFVLTPLRDTQSGLVATVVVVLASVVVVLANEGDNLPAIDTKVDAVYFTVTTLATVGFGDITPTSQSARLVVTVQMIFDLTVVAVAARLIFGWPRPEPATAAKALPTDEIAPARRTSDGRWRLPDRPGPIRCGPSRVELWGIHSLECYRCSEP